MTASTNKTQHSMGDWNSLLGEDPVRDLHIRMIQVNTRVIDSLKIVLDKQDGKWFSFDPPFVYEAFGQSHSAYSIGVHAMALDGDQIMVVPSSGLAINIIDTPLDFRVRVFESMQRKGFQSSSRAKAIELYPWLGNNSQENT